MTDEQRRLHRNCDGRTNPNLYVKGLGLVDRCPWHEYEEDTEALIHAWSEWKAWGVLPFQSGDDLFDEPAFVAEGFAVVEATIAKAEANERKSAQLEQEAKLEAARRGRHKATGHH